MAVLEICQQLYSTEIIKICNRTAQGLSQNGHQLETSGSTDASRLNVSPGDTVTPHRSGRERGYSRHELWKTDVNAKGHSGHPFPST